MAQLSFERAHSLGARTAREVAQRLADEMQTEYGVKFHWEGDELHFSRIGLSGVLSVDPDRIRLVAQLGFLFSAYKPRIEDAMSSNFERYFGAGAS
jgi:putative polyhydroxyalkanoate system protein